MREEPDLGPRNATSDESGDAIEHAERGVSGRARDLLDQELARRHIEQHEIGMRPPDVDAEPVAGLNHVRLPAAICAGVTPASAGIQ
jgi:hypothetical protein